MARRLRRIEAGGPARTPVGGHAADETPEPVRGWQEAGSWGVLARPVATARLLDMFGEIAEGRAGGRARYEPAAERIDASVFDPAVLDELASIGTGGSFERRFTAECLADAERGIGLLADCASRSDWAQIREHALAIKGVAGGVGLVRLAATAGEMTRMPDWQLAGEWRSRVSTLRERLAQGRELLATRHEPCRNYVRSD
jgi:two-component system sensor histidine kinase RpfC